MNSFKRLRCFFCLFLAVVMLQISGCSFQGKGSLPSTSQPEESICKSILTDTSCTPPCWEMIAPGTQSNSQKIREFLEGLPSADLIQEEKLPTSGGKEVSVIHWFWKATTSRNMITLDEDGTILGTVLQLTCNLTVEDVIAKYGNPEAVNWGYFGDDSYVRFNMFYFKKGLQFIVNLTPIVNPVLEPGSKVVEAALGEPFSPNDTMDLSEWPGYGRLD